MLGGLVREWGLMVWMVFYSAVNFNSVISRRQLTYLCISCVTPVLGSDSELSCPRENPWKIKRISETRERE